MINPLKKILKAVASLSSIVGLNKNWILIAHLYSEAENTNSLSLNPSPLWTYLLICVSSLILHVIENKKSCPPIYGGQLFLFVAGFI